MAYKKGSHTPILKLGVLDQSPISSGQTAGDAIRQSIELAKITEAAGFDRYWVAEHHSSNSFAGCSPEVLIPRIAAETTSIRVGAGGVMLPHYSPFKVAENFRLLETMFPGRIDLGIGRAPGSDVLTAQALAYGSTIGIEYFVNKVADLKALLEDKPPLTRGLESVFASPRTPGSPEMWMLGSSAQSAHYAAHFNLPYSFAHFIAPDQSLDCVEQYRAACGESGCEPRINLGVFVLCAETSEKADDLAACRDLWRLRFERGDPDPCPSIHEAREYKYSEGEKHRLKARRKHLIAGTPDMVKTKLTDLAAEHKINELVVVTICHQFEDRADSYRLLAEAFQLSAA